MEAYSVVNQELRLALTVRERIPSSGPCGIIKASDNAKGFRVPFALSHKPVQRKLRKTNDMNHWTETRTTQYRKRSKKERARSELDISLKEKGLLRVMPVKLTEIHVETAKKPKKRQYHSKSRNGCLTCKIRRVKCDERKLICLRCVDANMKCDGYAPPPEVKFQEAKPQRRPLAPRSGEGHRGRPLKPMSCYELKHLQGSPEDQRCFDFFIKKTAPLLSSDVDTWFWSKFLLQISSSEPTIWHSVLALSTLHEERLSRYPGTKSEESKTNRRRYALSHYNKAINSLTNKLSKKPASPEVVLVSCVVFIALETLLGNVSGAISHLQSGMEIIKEHRGSYLPLAPPPPPDSSPTPPSSITTALHEDVIPMLENLNCNTFMYGRTSFSQLPLDQIDETLTDFASLKEARQSIMAVQAAGQQLAVIAYSKDAAANLQATYAMLISYQQKLVLRAKGWGEPFEKLMATPKMQNLSAGDRREVTLLRLMHCTSLIWANNALYTEEVSFDKFVADFEHAINLGEQSMLTKGSDETSYSFDGGVMIPIYFAAVRCRNPVIRRRALNLLKRMPPREGFWDTTLIARVVEALIDIEEVGLENLRDPTGLIVPSESSRIHQTNLRPEVVDGKTKVVVTFIKKMDNGSENWDLKQEFWMECAL